MQFWLFLLSIYQQNNTNSGGDSEIKQHSSPANNLSNYNCAILVFPKTLPVQAMFVQMTSVLVKGRMTGSKKYKNGCGSKLSNKLQIAVNHDVLQDCAGSAFLGHVGHGGWILMGQWYIYKSCSFSFCLALLITFSIAYFYFILITNNNAD